MPDIFHYTDPVRFLEDWFTEREGETSRRAFARRVHCSPSLVVGVLKGRNRLDPARAEIWAKKGLKLDGAQTRQFVALVTLAGASGHVEREAAWERVRTSKSFREARRATDDTYELYSDRVVASTLELAQCAGFKDDPDWIAAHLWPRATRAEVVNALSVLERLGALRRDEQGQLRSTETTWVTEHEVDPGLVNLALVGLHRDAMARATQALEQIPWTERHFATLAVPVDERRVAAIKEAIHRFQEEVVRITGEGEGTPDRVVQLCVQLFPMSTSTRQPRKRRAAGA